MSSGAFLFLPHRGGFLFCLESWWIMSVEISILVGVLGLLFAIFGYVLNRDRDKKNETKNEAKLEARLEYISKGIDDIRIDIKANKEQMAIFGERLTRVEESTKSAHKRIDKLEGKVDEN